MGVGGESSTYICTNMNKTPRKRKEKKKMSKHEGKPTWHLSCTPVAWIKLSREPRVRSVRSERQCI